MPNFSDKLMGLLNDPRTMDIGMGLLSAGGPSFTPHNMGQDMASAYQYANSREGERAQLEMQRMQLNQQKKQQAARAQIGQIYANTQTPQQIGQGVAGQMGILGAGPGMLNPQTQAQYVRANQGLNAINNQRQQQLPGLLSEAYPEQYGAAQIKGLFGTPPKTSSDFNDLRQILGRDPTQAELAAGNAPSALEQARLDQIAVAMSRTAEEATLSTAERQRSVRRRQDGSTRSVAKIGEILDEIESAQGTMAQSGGLADATNFLSSTWAGIQRVAGADSTDASKVATSIQKLDKKFSELGSGMIPDAFMGSNAKLEAFQAQLPSSSLEMGANLSIMKSALEGVISEEKIYHGIDADTPTIRDAEAKLARVYLILQGGVPTPPPGTVEIQ
jgi:hypothetical protein